MDISSAKWLSELEMEDDYNFINECQINSLDHELTTHELESALENNFQQSLSPDSNSSYPLIFNTHNQTTATAAAATSLSGSSIESCQTAGSGGIESRPTKLLKPDNWKNSSKPEHVTLRSSPSSQLLSFAKAPTEEQVVSINGNLDFQYMINISEGSHDNNLNFAPNGGQLRTKRVSTMCTTKTPPHLHDHIIAERKRREKLSQRFIALSAIVPGLKKMDKASVLEDATKYLKQLQERVKLMEEQISKKKIVESVILVKKSQLSGDDDDTSSSDENFGGHSEDALPEIEARVSEKDVLIRIHCEKQKGFVVKILSEIEKLHLSIINSSFLPFGDYTMDITVVAQMDTDFNMTVKDLVKNLRVAFLKLM